ncbi:MAG: autotransporter outer membrane beta-barrel domain-containing protein [Betaproteobacteria bacterium]|nr:autotransporter outer membrane beta-barrel domain-containing protein [Betaproteobacteria bacterium]
MRGLRGPFAERGGRTAGVEDPRADGGDGAGHAAGAVAERAFPAGATAVAPQSGGARGIARARRGTVAAVGERVRADAAGQERQAGAATGRRRGGRRSVRAAGRVCQRRPRVREAVEERRAQWFDLNTRSLTAGADYRLPGDSVVGVAAGYMHASADLTEAGGSQGASGYSFSAYGSFVPMPGAYVDVIAHAGTNKYDTRRREITDAGRRSTQQQHARQPVRAGDHRRRRPQSRAADDESVPAHGLRERQGQCVQRDGRRRRDPHRRPRPEADCAYAGRAGQLRDEHELGRAAAQRAPGVAAAAPGRWPQRHRAAGRRRRCQSQVASGDRTRTTATSRSGSRRCCRAGSAASPTTSGCSAATATGIRNTRWACASSSEVGRRGGMRRP